METKQANSKSIFKNAIFGFSTWILPLGLSFFATPILVKSLGNEDYGIYTLVLGFIAYSFNFGIGRAITKYIAEYRASGQNEKITEIISATFFLNIAVGLIGMTTIFLISKKLVVDVFQIEAEFQQKTIYAFYIAAATIFCLMLVQVFNAVLQGIHRFDVYSKIFNLNILTLIGGNILLALNGFGLVGLLFWNLIITFLTCFAYFISAKMLLPEFGINFNFSRKTLKIVGNFSFGIVGYQILANILLLFERGWITRKLGADVLTHYVVPMMLSLYIHSFISSLTLIIFPLASELKDQKEKLLNLYTKATKIITLLVVFMGTSLIVQSYEFLALWMGTDFADKSSNLLIVHTITFSLIAIQIISWQMTEGLGFPNFNFKMIGICLVITITGFITTTSDYGSFGIAISRMLGFSAIFLSVFYVEKWFFGKIQFKLWLKIIGILGVSAMIAAFIEKIIINNFPVSWLTFIFSVISGGIVYCLFVWIMGFITDEEKVYFKQILKR